MVSEHTGPLVVIVGETASGKSALALEVAKKVGGEIVSADSWTVYRDFNIGTAKPNADERAEVRHHLLDIVDPTAGYSAAVFKRDALSVIADITSRGKIPILVGGTGLYVDSVLYDYGFLSPPANGIREELNGKSLDQLLIKANALSLDLSRIDIHNKRRVIRLIENNGQMPTKAGIRKNTLIVGIRIERLELERKVKERVDKMFQQGLQEEARNLSVKYGWGVEPMKGIGYREFQQYYLGNQELEQTKAQIIKSTLDLAKRQRTWFKRNKSIQWVDDRSNAVEIITTFLNK